MREKIVQPKEFRIIGKENPRRASRLEGKVKKQRHQKRQEKRETFQII